MKAKSLICYIFAALILVSQAWAQSDELIVLEVPEGYKNASWCPPIEEYQEQIPDDYQKYTVMCGNIRSVFLNTDFSTNAQTSGNGLGGVMMAAYRNISGTEFIDLLGWTFTDENGYYVLPVPRLSKVYVAILSEDDGDYYIRDSYIITPARMGGANGYFHMPDLGVAARSTTLYEDGIVPPERLSFYIENLTLECLPQETEGIGTVFTPTSESVQVAKPLYTDNTDDWYAKKRAFWPKESNLACNFGPCQIEENARESNEGRYTSLVARDKNVYNATNIVQLGSQENYVENYPDTQPDVPSCEGEKFTEAGKIIGPYNSWLTGGIIQLMIPGYINQIADTISPELMEATPVCQNGDGSYVFLDQLSPSHPVYAETIMQLIGNSDHVKKASQEFQINKVTNDSLENDPETGVCRDMEFDIENDPGNVTRKPAEACSIVKNPGLNLSKAQLTDQFSTNPFQILQTPGFGLTADTTPARLGTAVTRIGTVQPVCTCSTIWGENCSSPISSLLTFIDTVAGSYKVSSPDATDLDTLFSFELNDNSFIRDIGGFLQNLLSRYPDEYPTDVDIREAIRDDDPCFKYLENELYEGDDCGPLCEDEFCDDDWQNWNGNDCEPGSNGCILTCYKKMYEYQDECSGQTEYNIEVASITNQYPEAEVLDQDPTQSVEFARRLFQIPSDSYNYAVKGTYSVIHQAIDQEGDNPKAASIVDDPNDPAAMIPDSDVMRFSTQVYNKNIMVETNEAFIVPVDDLPSVCLGEAWDEWFGDVDMPEPSSITSMAQSYFNTGVMSALSGENGEIVTDAYSFAEEETGIPCEILAGIHAMEGSNLSYRSLEDGSEVSSPEELRASAVGVAQRLKNYVEQGAGAGCENMNNSTEFTSFTGALSCRGGSGNSNCSYRDLTDYSECPREYLGEDDPYPMNWLDDKHTNMALITVKDGPIRADEFCTPAYCDPGGMYYDPKYADVCLLCPVPIEFNRAGVWAIAILYHNYIAGE